MTQIYTRIGQISDTFFPSLPCQSDLLSTIIDVMENQINQGDDISLLLSDGIPITLESFNNQLNRSIVEPRDSEFLSKSTRNFSSHTGTSDDVEGENEKRQRESLVSLLDCVRELPGRFVTAGSYNLLIFIKYSCEFFVTNFDPEVSVVDRFIRLKRKKGVEDPLLAGYPQRRERSR